MFQIKNFAGITADMIRHMLTTQNRITDFHVGSVARTLVEAPAVELDEFYQRVLLGLLEAIPVAVYQAFGFEQLPAAAASGDVTFTVSPAVVNAVPIPAGTVVQRAGTRLRYVTLEAGEIPAGGTTATIPVAAEWAGADGNAGSGTLSQIVSSLAATMTVSNLNPVTGGTEAETADERKARFIDYVGSLSRGTVWAVTYAAKSATVKDASGQVIEWVARAGLVEEAGHADIYIQGSNGTPSLALLDAAQAIMDGQFDQQTQSWVPGYRPVGVRVTINPMLDRAVAVQLRVKQFDGLPGSAETIALIRDALSGLLTAARPGDVVFIEQMAEVVLTVSGLERCLVDNSSNVLCAANEALSLGVLTVQWDAE